jgi:protein TonB
VPQLATPDSFVQKIQPPPPENINISAAMNIVPEIRDPNMFKGMKVFDISMLDTIPDPKFRMKPQYPFEMRRAGIAGEVTVDFIVDTNGDVQNAYAIRSSQREFESAAVAAVSKWKFKPGRKAGKDVPTHMQVPIVFTLNED